MDEKLIGDATCYGGAEQGFSVSVNGVLQLAYVDDPMEGLHD